AARDDRYEERPAPGKGRRPLRVGWLAAGAGQVAGRFPPGGLALDDGRDDERVAAGGLPDVAAHRVEDVVADVRQGALLAHALLQALLGDALDLLDQPVLPLHYTAGDDLDGGRLLAGQRHDHDHALLGEGEAVADDGLGDLADAVYQHHAGVHLGHDRQV